VGAGQNSLAAIGALGLRKLCRILKKPYSHRHTLVGSVSWAGGGGLGVRIIAALVFVVAAASKAQAEAWTCTGVMEGLKEAFLRRFVVLKTEVIEAKTNEHYWLLQNNEYGLIATSSISEIEQGQDKPTVGASTIVIDKTTNEFRWETIIMGVAPLVGANTPVRGKCIGD
jgi:hypothetical protein